MTFVSQLNLSDLHLPGTSCTNHIDFRPNISARFNPEFQTHSESARMTECSLYIPISVELTVPAGVTDSTLTTPLSKYANEHNQGFPSLPHKESITSNESTCQEESYKCGHLGILGQPWLWSLSRAVCADDRSPPFRETGSRCNPNPNASLGNLMDLVDIGEEPIVLSPGVSLSLEALLYPLFCGYIF